MKYKKQILPIGSIITVCYEHEEGLETKLMVIGHLCLRKRFICHYDYVCVRCPYGLEDGLCYINVSDIVRVLCCPDVTDEKYRQWYERKHYEFMAYYRNYRPDREADINVMRENQIRWENLIDEKERTHKIIRITGITLLIVGTGLAVLLTECWWMGIGAILFAATGYMIKK